jgi:CheY-like chemotaxis protein
MESRPTILLVDYQPRSIQRARQLLEGAGYRVEVATDGALALSMFANSSPGLVLILEAMLPKKHGFEVCREMKRSKRGSTPVILATAVYRGRKYRQDAMHEIGCDEYLERPVGDEQLLAAVQRLLPLQAASQPPQPETIGFPTPEAFVLPRDIEERVDAAFGLASPPAEEPGAIEEATEEIVGVAGALQDADSGPQQTGEGPPQAVIDAESEWERDEPPAELESAPVVPSGEAFLPGIEAELDEALRSLSGKLENHRLASAIEAIEAEREAEAADRLTTDKPEAEDYTGLDDENAPRAGGEELPLLAPPLPVETGALELAGEVTSLSATARWILIGSAGIAAVVLLLFTILLLRSGAP